MMHRPDPYLVVNQINRFCFFWLCKKVPDLAFINLATLLIHLTAKRGMLITPIMLLKSTSWNKIAIWNGSILLLMFHTTSVHKKYYVVLKEFVEQQDNATVHMYIQLQCHLRYLSIGKVNKNFWSASLNYWRYIRCGFQSELIY